MKKLALLLISGIALVACNEKEYTVDDFMKNDQLRTEWLKKCENGEVRPELLNCINSKKAIDKMRTHNFDYLDNLGK
ncbi:EexN family lipoprotein [Rodentibacter sp. Ppn85]|uniref:EexN family lipoprotein n=1 Tax=Rodentibacter sp. Ppn85 TaxID=1908525 RepID=UPI0009872C32|nr:EexN family lipoprotein [Rodentibacter sp. Ppn85]OOF66774.1 hypothetical protein BKL51_00860 [Rodentibacter sp. Ppn85]